MLCAVRAQLTDVCARRRCWIRVLLAGLASSLTAVADAHGVLAAYTACCPACGRSGGVGVMSDASTVNTVISKHSMPRAAALVHPRKAACLRHGSNPSRAE